MHTPRHCREANFTTFDNQTLFTATGPAPISGAAVWCYSIAAMSILRGLAI